LEFVVVLWNREVKKENREVKKENREVRRAEQWKIRVG
jgi:hypothetical protein